MSRSVTRFSYIFIGAVLVLVGWLHLGTISLTLLFSYLVLSKLNFAKRKWVAVLFFLVLVTGIFWAFGYFINQAVEALPKVATQSLPILAEQAKRYGFDIPTLEGGDINAFLVDTVHSQLAELARFATFATKEFVFLLVGLVVAISIFLNSRINLDSAGSGPNLYGEACDELSLRFRSFYKSFETVIGAQLLISIINTFFTLVFVFWIQLPYAIVVIGITFLCGLLPVVGNLISNTVIVGIAITQSPSLAVVALLFLIALHKTEYFLNSKIIGGRIRNPMWLTLIGLVLGERLMGIPGMILAPVILYYVKLEASAVPVIGEAASAPTLRDVSLEKHAGEVRQ